MNKSGEVLRIPQKQEGLFRVRFPVPAGDLSASLVAGLNKIAERYGRGEFRCTGRHELEIPFIAENHVQAVSSALDRLGMKTVREGRHPNVVACPGADHCTAAYARTKNLYFEIESLLLKTETTRTLPPDFQVAVSGCPNECSQVLINDIGFIGAIGSYQGQKAQGFEMVVGGSIRGEGQLATRIAFVSSEDVVPTLRDVIEIYYQQAVEGTPFHDFFFFKGPEAFSMLLLQQLKQRMSFFQI